MKTQNPWWPRSQLASSDTHLNHAGSQLRLDWETRGRDEIADASTKKECLRWTQNSNRLGYFENVLEGFPNQLFCYLYFCGQTLQGFFQTPCKAASFIIFCAQYLQRLREIAGITSDVKMSQMYTQGLWCHYGLWSIAKSGTSWRALSHIYEHGLVQATGEQCWKWYLKAIIVASDLAFDDRQLRWVESLFRVRIPVNSQTLYSETFGQRNVFVQNKLRLVFWEEILSPLLRPNPSCLVLNLQLMHCKASARPAPIAVFILWTYYFGL